MESDNWKPIAANGTKFGNRILTWLPKKVPKVQCILGGNLCYKYSDNQLMQKECNQSYQKFIQCHLEVGFDSIRCSLTFSKKLSLASVFSLVETFGFISFIEIKFRWFETDVHQIWFHKKQWVFSNWTPNNIF